MANVILMDATQAASVRGVSSTDKSQILTPAPLTDGRFILGPQNIDNPAFADRADLLKSFPQVDYSTIAALVPKMVMS